MSLTIEQWLSVEGVGTDYPSHPLISDFITASKELTSVNFFGDDYNRAVALRVLHMIAKKDVNSRHTGGTMSYIDGPGLKVSLAYSQENLRKHPDLSGTSYGSTLIQLMDSIPCVVIRNR